MAKKRRLTPRRQARPLYVVEWIVRLGRTQAEVARAAGIGESYLSTLGSGKRANPAAAIMYEISEFLGVSVNDLYRPPPPRVATEAVERLSPAQVATLGRLLDEMKNPPRK